MIGEDGPKPINPKVTQPHPLGLQVIRYQDAGLVAVAPAQPEHSSSSAPHRPPFQPGGWVPEPDARYSDVLDERMQADGGGVRDLRGMYVMAAESGASAAGRTALLASPSARAASSLPLPSGEFSPNSLLYRL